MRRIIATSLLAIVFTSITISANAAVKPGTTCKKIGQTSTSAGINYTCIKSGKKLVWGIGISVSKKNPGRTSNQSDQSTNTQTSKTLPSEPRMPKEPTSFSDLIANYEGVSYAAWRKSQSKILNSVKSDISLNLIVGPTTKLTYPTPQKAIDLITQLYAGYATEGEINYLAFNFEDRDWAIAKMESILPNSGSRWIADTACRTKETCWGGGAFSNGLGKFLIVEAMGILDTNHTSGSLEAHEFTHIVQQMSFKKGRPPTAYLYDPWPPTWYWEGQAHFAQHASIYVDSFDAYVRERNATAKSLFSSVTMDLANIQNYFTFNAPIDWQRNYDPWRQYDLGAMFVEILTAIKGPDSTMEIWKLTGTGMNFEEAFRNVYEIPFAEALPIMSKTIALELGRP